LDPEVGGEEKIMKSAEDLEKSKDKANGGGGVQPSIFEHGHEPFSFVSSHYIPSSSWSFFDNPFELPQQASTRSSFPQPDISYSDRPQILGGFTRILGFTTSLVLLLHRLSGASICLLLASI
jgi:hypothetical protein